MTSIVNMRKTKNPFSLSASTKPDRLAEIYRAAASIICEKGYDATSMNDIAEAVGITKSGLYHHVSGKRNLLFNIMSFGMDSLEEQVIIPARALTDAEERLRAIITSHVHLITSRSTPRLRLQQSPHCDLGDLFGNLIWRKPASGVIPT